MFYNNKERMKWFLHDRFGMFIHWGLYAIPARGEWVRSIEKINKKDYQQYFDEFNPVDYNPVEWAKAAKAAGMKYAVFTTKHHDGFCLFDSKLTDYKSTNTKAGRDLVAEYVEAFREQGLKVGLYYSLIDWHHPDYPHYGDQTHPMRENIAFKDTKHNFDNYLEYMHGQIKELCCNYGKIDIMWFDYSYDKMTGEKWRATDLVRMIRTFQPDVVIDNRLDLQNNASLLNEQPFEYSGDFISPEQLIPAEGIKNCKGEAVPWESCITMNRNWGYCGSDQDFKSASAVILKLVECVSKSGNLLINIGPDARGNIPKQSLAILNKIGEWMRLNSESIYGCTRADIPKPENGYLTQKDNIYYYHLIEKSFDSIRLMGFNPAEIKKIRLLADGSEINVLTRWPESDHPTIAFVSVCENEMMFGEAHKVLKIEMK